MNMTKLMRFVIAPRCWKITKKSHLTLRAKRATFTFGVDKSSLKVPKRQKIMENATFLVIFTQCAAVTHMIQFA